jgi:hypothetical protein
MQAEELIQEKEWQQLSSEERTFLQPLASSEGEFNLLKKMLLVSTEELENIPAIDPDIQTRVKKSLQKKSTTHFLRKWQFAAAIAVLVLLCGWLIFFKKEASNKIVVTPPQSEMKSIERHPHPPDTSLSPDTIEKPVLVKKSNPNKKGNIALDQPIPVDDKNRLALNTSVGQNPELINLITEAYE